MKRSIVLILFVLSVISCKNDSKTTEENTTITEKNETVLKEGEQIFRGEFIYLEDAAVLTAKSDIYAVKIDDKMRELEKVAQALKKTEYDMVNVVLHGTLAPNPLKETSGEGWDQMITITEVIEVTPASSVNVIETGKSIDIKDVK